MIRKMIIWRKDKGDKTSRGAGNYCLSRLAASSFPHPYFVPVLYWCSASSRRPLGASGQTAELRKPRLRGSDLGLGSRLPVSRNRSALALALTFCRCFSFGFHLILTTRYEEGTVVIPVLQMWEMRGGQMEPRCPGPAVCARTPFYKLIVQLCLMSFR